MMRRSKPATAVPKAPLALRLILGLFLIGMTAQFFIAGLFLFDAAEIDAHIISGHLNQLLSLVALVIAASTRAGRFYVIALFLTTVLLVVQMLIPALRDDLPAVAALHVLNPLLVWALVHSCFHRAMTGHRRAAAAPLATAPGMDDTVAAPAAPATPAPDAPPVPDPARDPDSPEA